MASAVAILAGAVALRAGGLVPFQAYPLLHAGLPAGGLIGCGGLIAVALAPFADRRGVETWSR
jgi:hypothetical protein